MPLLGAHIFKDRTKLKKTNVAILGMRKKMGLLRKNYELREELLRSGKAALKEKEIEKSNLLLKRHVFFKQEAQKSTERSPRGESSVIHFSHFKATPEVPDKRSASALNGTLFRPPQMSTSPRTVGKSKLMSQSVKGNQNSLSYLPHI